MEAKKISVVKNHTYGGDLCKQTFTIITGDNGEKAVYIKKLVLAKDLDTLKVLCEHGFAKGRIFKDTTLMGQQFIMKLDTFRYVAILIDIIEKT